MKLIVAVPYCSAKGMDFRAVTEKSLADAVKMLNHRPRKCLDYRTPHAVFQLAKSGAVAM